MQLNLVKQHLCTTIVENIGYLEIITNFCADCETKNQGQNQTKTKCNKVQPPHNESVKLILMNSSYCSSTSTFLDIDDCTKHAADRT